MNTKNNWATTKKNKHKALNLWSLFWVVTMAITSFGPHFVWEQKVFTVISIIINTLIGIKMIKANIDYVNALDEMMRKIHIEAMAVALGVGIVLGLSYSVLDTTNLINFNAEIAHVVILMSLVYIIGILWGKKKFQ